MSIYLTSLTAIVGRDFLRFFNQRGRLVSALVRPLVWYLYSPQVSGPRLAYLFRHLMKHTLITRITLSLDFVE